VLADLGVLETLPPREVWAGYAEIAKYGMIGDVDFFAWCEANSDWILGKAKNPFGDPGGHYDGIMAINYEMRRWRMEALAHAVEYSVRAKARVVAADEREGGQRALLNLGHTFAHALEAHQGFTGGLLHGEAVAVGCALAFKLSARLGLCPQADADRVRHHLAQAGFELDLRRLPGAPFDAERLIALMHQDKKTESGALTLILARGLGQAFVQKHADPEPVRALLHEEVRVTL
jgi:3-dehydroquinate synthase